MTATTPLFVADDLGAVVVGLLVLLHGWAGVLHTDGTYELRREPIDRCPECEQDRAR